MGSQDLVTFTVEGSEEVVKFRIHIPQSATILQLRERIQQYTGVDLDRQIIFDKETRLLWLDFQTVGECGYTSSGTIFLLVLPLPLGAQLCIKISSWAAEFHLTVQDNDTVSDLKKKIRTERKFSPEKRINLFHLFTEMHDHDPLYKYYVNVGSTITMTHV
ncbi:hypothetical protein VitviT2T_017920 [Vitis vinifera]|uniref:Ubiquitin-like domain-containing protein n=1 Tax=Vitis vinifera TaxID=29760 RepID=A0ABY9CVQ0_VITVI|nr:hypothetical protein VitviT2T_017920 [Vitis vinifera]